MIVLNQSKKTLTSPVYLVTLARPAIVEHYATKVYETSGDLNILTTCMNSIDFDPDDLEASPPHPALL